MHGPLVLYFVAMGMRPDAGGAGLIRGPVQQLPFELSLRLCFYAFLYPTGRERTSSGERRERSDRLYTDYREPRATLANWRDPHTP